MKDRIVHRNLNKKCLAFQSFLFHKPVNKKFVKDYYEVIKKPMDLETLAKVRCSPVFSPASEYRIHHETFESLSYDIT